MHKILVLIIIMMLLISCSEDKTVKKVDTLVRIVNNDPNMDAIIAYCFDDNYERDWQYPLQNIQLNYGDSIEVSIETKANMQVRHSLVGMINDEEFIYSWQGILMEYEEGILRLECFYIPEVEFPNNHQFYYAYWSEAWDED